MSIHEMEDILDGLSRPPSSRNVQRSVQQAKDTERKRMQAQRMEYEKEKKLKRNIIPYRNRSIMFVGDLSFSGLKPESDKYNDAAKEMDKFLQENPGIEILNTEFRFSGDHVGSHAILMMYREKKTKEEIDAEFHKLKEEMEQKEKGE